MIIRLATFNDLPTILAIVREVVPQMHATGNFQWENTYPNETVFRQDINQQQLWVAELDGSVAGVAALTTDQDEEYAQADWDVTEPAIVTHRLAVHPGFQGRGVAAVLLQQAEVVAIERGIPVLRVDTNSENAATQRLFPKLGYRFAGEISLNSRSSLRFYCYEKRV